MRIVRDSSEAEMVAGFLAGELRSLRFGQELALVMARRGQPTQLLTDPNLQAAGENQKRRRVLGDFRGYLRSPADRTIPSGR